MPDDDIRDMTVDEAVARVPDLEALIAEPADLASIAEIVGTRDVPMSCAGRCLSASRRLPVAAR